MNTRLVLGSLAFLTATVLATACASTDDNAGKNDDNEVISTHNETASTFGLTTHEIALTLDDGPGPRTIEIAEWLAKEKIPAAFFMIGKSATAPRNEVTGRARRLCSRLRPCPHPKRPKKPPRHPFSHERSGSSATFTMAKPGPHSSSR